MEDSKDDRGVLGRLGIDGAGLMEWVPDSVVVVTADGLIAEVNTFLLRTLGYDRHELVGQPIELLIPTRLRASHIAKRNGYLMHPMMRPMGVARKLLARRKDGTEFPVDIMLGPLRREAGSPVMAVMRDVTEREALVGELKRRAYYDELTGLRNRAAFNLDLTALLGAPDAAADRFCVALIDLDRFKEVNDTLGHMAGDALLKEAGRRMTQLVGERMTCYRLGGDEFAVIMPACVNGGGPSAFARRVIDEIKKPFLIGGERVRIGASAGIVSAPDDGTSSGELMAHADLSLYPAKANGRGQYHRYAASLGQAAHASRRLMQELAAAFEEGQFELFYQPQVDLGDGTIVGAEALLRWRHPTKGIVPPAKFIDALAACELAESVGEWMIATACAEAARLRADVNPQFKVAVNVFARHLASRNLLAAVEGALTAAGVGQEAIEIEITEDISPRSGGDCLENTGRLGALGIALVLDDFGTGFASIRTLSPLPIGKVKIDKQFVTGGADRPRNAAVVEAMMGLARALGIVGLADGIETGDDLRFARILGRGVGQGSLFGPPMPARELEDLVRAFARSTQPLPGGITGWRDSKPSCTPRAAAE